MAELLTDCLESEYVIENIHGDLWVLYVKYHDRAQRNNMMVDVIVDL